MDLTDQRLDLERDGYIAIADLLTEQYLYLGSVYGSVYGVRALYGVRASLAISKAFSQVLWVSIWGQSFISH